MGFYKPKGTRSKLKKTIINGNAYEFTIYHHISYFPLAKINKMQFCL